MGEREPVLVVHVSERGRACIECACVCKRENMCIVCVSVKEGKHVLCACV